jgi:hypothetical protein
VLAAPEPLPGVHAVDDWDWAQARANFVIVGPIASGPWRIAKPSLRGESNEHHGTLRYFLEDAAGRRLRVKQYYNDWWIPTVADISFRKPGRPVVAGERVAFVGRDYRRQDASCGHRWGTNTEFSVDAGALTDEEWSALWASLDALVPAARAAARASSFAQRNYWNRFGRSRAPWDTTEIASLRWHPPTSEAMDRAAWALTADRWAPVPGVIDSLGFRDDGPQGREAQFVFRWPVDLDCSAWMRVLEAPPEPWRPLVDASEVNRPQWVAHEVAGVPTERAAMESSVGNWYYAWREGPKAYELHLRARKGLGPQAADAVVRGLLA